MLEREKTLKLFLFYILQAKKESKRTHQGFCRLLKNVGKADSLLDIGAADGVKTLNYAEILNTTPENIWGIEVGEHYLDILTEKRINITVIDLEKESFPYDDESFDVITCNQVLEHLKNIWLPLSEMERVLKTGGYLAIGIPNLAALHNRILLSLGFQPHCNRIMGPHIRCFTNKAFIDILKSNRSFHMLANTGATLYPFPYPIVEFGAYIFPGLSAVTFYLLKKVKHNPQQTTWRRDSIGDTYLGDTYL